MREVKFRMYPGTGDEEPSWKTAPIDEFLLTAPVFSYELKVFGVIPPLHVLNEIFSKGSNDSGMGGACDWKPFEINSDEFKALTTSLITNPEHSIIEDKDLGNRLNFKEWRSGLLSKYAKNIRSSR